MLQVRQVFDRSHRWNKGVKGGAKINSAGPIIPRVYILVKYIENFQNIS